VRASSQAAKSFIWLSVGVLHFPTRAESGERQVLDTRAASSWGTSYRPTVSGKSVILVADATSLSEYENRRILPTFTFPFAIP
jgi:hypothetical protein